MTMNGVAKKVTLTPLPRCPHRAPIALPIATQRSWHGCGMILTLPDWSDPLKQAGGLMTRSLKTLGTALLHGLNVGLCDIM